MRADTSYIEWKGRNDGLVAHVFFQKNHNFALSVFAFAVEGYGPHALALTRVTDLFLRWIYYSAVNSVVPQIILNLGFEDNAWIISIRQLSFNLPIILIPIPVV